MSGDATGRDVRVLLTRDLLDQAVRALALGDGPLQERLERASVPLASVSRRDLEQEEELALYARVQLGLTRLRGTAGEIRADDVPVFALEATASHIVELRDATTRRAVRVARSLSRRRRG